MNRPIDFIKCVLAVATIAALAAPFATEAQSSSKYDVSSPNSVSPFFPTGTSRYFPSPLNFYSVLSAESGSRGAVTCTDSSIHANVGSSGARPAVVITRCSIAGLIIAPVSATVLAEFNHSFDMVGSQQCQHALTGSLAGVILAPGVYCFAASASLTGTLTLKGPSTGVWTFLVNGNLTGNSFSMVMADQGQPCNVLWESSGATTMTTSNAKGNFLAGQAITLTGGSFVGRAFAKMAVTTTGVAITGCR